jgi:hypothetical protein
MQWFSFLYVRVQYCNLNKDFINRLNTGSFHVPLNLYCCEVLKFYKHNKYSETSIHRFRRRS